MDMNQQETPILEMHGRQIEALAEEVRGYRKDLNGRLRELELAEAARKAREAMENELGTKKLRRRDIYVPLIVTNALYLCGVAAALFFR